MNHVPDSHRHGSAPVEAVLSTQILSKNGKASREDGWTHERRSLFLGALSGGVSVESAATTAGMSRTSAYALKCRDPLFSCQCADAIQEGVMAARDELLTRAMGMKRTNRYDKDGNIIGYNETQNDRMLIYFLNRYDRHVHADYGRRNPAYDHPAARNDLRGQYSKGAQPHYSVLTEEELEQSQFASGLASTEKPPEPEQPSEQADDGWSVKEAPSETSEQRYQLVCEHFDRWLDEAIECATERAEMIEEGVEESMLPPQPMLASFPIRPEEPDAEKVPYSHEETLGLLAIWMALEFGLLPSHPDYPQELETAFATGACVRFPVAAKAVDKLTDLSGSMWPLHLSFVSKDYIQPEKQRRFLAERRAGIEARTQARKAGPAEEGDKCLAVES